MTAERERCPVCDAPLAVEADHEAWIAAGEPDDYRPDLCWTGRLGISGDHEGREPVDWRARAIAAEQRLAARRAEPVEKSEAEGEPW